MPNEAASRSCGSSVVTAAAGMDFRNTAQETTEQLDSGDQEVFMLLPARRRTSCSSASSDSSSCDISGDREPTAVGGRHLQRSGQGGNATMAPPRSLPPATAAAATTTNRRGKAYQQQNRGPAGSAQQVHNRQQIASNQQDISKPQVVRKQQRQQQRTSQLDQQQQDVQPRQRQQQQRQQQQVASLEDQEQYMLLCKLCQRPETSCEGRSCPGYCRHCKKRGHLTVKCRKLAAAAAASQPATDTMTSSSSSSSTTAVEAVHASRRIRPELLLHKATALHALQQTVKNASLQQQLRTAIQAAGRQQVVAAVCQQLQKVSADVSADVDELSSEDLEQLVTFAELAAAAQQLQQQRAATQQRQRPALNGKRAPEAAAAAAPVLPSSGIKPPAESVSRPVEKAVKRKGPTPAADTQPRRLLQPPKQPTATSPANTPTAAPPPPPPAATAAAGSSHPTAGHREHLLAPPPPPPPRLPAPRAAHTAGARSSAAAVGNDPPSGPTPAGVQSQSQQQKEQQQQRQAGLQPPHPLYAGATALAAGTTAAAAAPPPTPPAAISAVPAPWPGQMPPSSVPVKLTGPLQPWMLMCKPGAQRAVHELIQQDQLVQSHLLRLIGNTADWQLVTVMGEELEFLVQLVGAGQLQVRGVEGMRQLSHLLGQARQMGPLSQQPEAPASLLPVSSHAAAVGAAVGAAARVAGVHAPAGGSPPAVQQVEAPLVPDACRQM